MTQSVDILIVGGGIIGSSIAMSLAERGVTAIAVVDCDMSGKWGASERNAGGVRAAWDMAINISLSKASIVFYESVAEAVGFQQKGYLWLHDEAAWPKAEQRVAVQSRLGVVAEVLTSDAVSARFPFLDRLDGVHRAVSYPKDGLLNPNLLKTYYRSCAEAAGVTWMDRQAVTSVSVAGESVRSVTLETIPGEPDLEQFLVHQSLPGEAARTRMKVGALVNAAGCWAPRLSELYGRTLPARPVRRQVSVAHAQEADLSPFGMFVDTSGLYFHHEAGNILAGYAVSSEKPGYCFEDEGDDFFMTEIWPRLAARSSRFERLKRIGGWAGLYAVSPDKSAIIGAAPGLKNVFEAHSFSGHGVMQSYAAGRGLAELMLTGSYQNLDLSPLSGDRFEKGTMVCEETHI
ncbi:MAG: NAD(P)/FAD-dependent oxidoreductase [Nitrospiria bacterium]